jgi:hypothetical protein
MSQSSEDDVTRKWFILAALAGGSATALWRWTWAAPLSDAAFAALYATPLAPPTGPLRTYHLGHSLVGRDMPAMLAQLAGHDYASQLGWGASLRQHWDREVPGFAAENAHAFYRAASEAVNYGNYDAIIFTEMVELRDAIRWHDSANALANWAAMARVATPGVRLYLYETWHRLDDPAGWLQRIDTDLSTLWQGEILRPAMARPGTGTIHVIPGGQVMAAAVRAIEGGHVPGLTLRADLFAKGADGTTDPIHLNDLGNYLMALTHFAVLYHRSPVGLPHDLARADGTPMTPLGRKTAEVLQEVVWRSVARYPFTGLAKGS